MSITSYRRVASKAHARIDTGYAGVTRLVRNEGEEGLCLEVTGAEIYVNEEHLDPIDMVLHCPECGVQHIDKPMTEAEYAARLHESSWWECGGDKPGRWTNPPHRSHLCHGCGHIWRPADVPTNGVRAVKTKGQNDSLIKGTAR